MSDWSEICARFDDFRARAERGDPEALQALSGVADEMYRVALSPNKPRAVATSDAVMYRPMSSYVPGTKCTLLTRSGVAVIGSLGSDGSMMGYAGWAPLPQIPDELRYLLRNVNEP